MTERPTARRFILAAVAAALVLVGCSEPNGTTKLDGRRQAVIEVELDDGRVIECIWLSVNAGRHSGLAGLDCDWHPTGDGTR